MSNRFEKLARLRREMKVVQHCIDTNEQMREYWTGVMRDMKVAERTLTGQTKRYGYTPEQLEKIYEGLTW